MTSTGVPNTNKLTKAIFLRVRAVSYGGFSHPTGQADKLARGGLVKPYLTGYTATAIVVITYTTRLWNKINKHSSKQFKICYVSLYFYHFHIERWHL